jgi:hypothetical protein
MCVVDGVFEGAAQIGQATTGVGKLKASPLDNVLSTQAEPAESAPPKRPTHYLWAVLIARI